MVDEISKAGKPVITHNGLLVRFFADVHALLLFFVGVDVGVGGVGFGVGVVIFLALFVLFDTLE